MNNQLSFSGFYQLASDFFKEHPDDIETMFIFYRGSITKTDADLDLFKDSTKLKPWLDEVDHACALRRETSTGNEIIAFKCRKLNGFCQRVL